MADAHRKDLETQGQYNVTYTRSSAGCLLGDRV